ncbi:Endonuclease V [Methanococcoides vulcani]|uniref:Endonuclease V n=1 Tax=Methanococcoides vulcani TaxID=1353158 RepID=A0A1I0A118_9EURY|nr:endonuclease V [Methanococcoides vulcani]SES87728.1 Endonuclease V [Methanococcoides vulcani]
MKTGAGLLDPKSHSPEFLRDIQAKIAASVSTEDEFGNLETIAGSDCAFLGDLIICGVILLDYDTMDVIERTHVIRKINFPYIPTYLSFREGKPIVDALSGLKGKPDLLMVDGCGINHPRKAGLASHIGVVTDMPAIGIAKKVLCGVADKPETGEANPLLFQGQQVGWLLKTNKRSNPIVVAPGHRISLNTCLEVTRKCLRGYKLPEPTRLAHMYVNEIKREMLKDEP